MPASGRRSATRGRHHRDRERHEDLLVELARLEAGRRTAVEVVAQCSEHEVAVCYLGADDVDGNLDALLGPARRHGTDVGLDQGDELAGEARVDVRRIERTMHRVELRAHVRIGGDHVGHDDTSARSADPVHLRERVLRVREVVQRGPADHEVEALAGERQVLRVALLEQHVVDSSGAQPLGPRLEQRGSEVDPDDLADVRGHLLRDVGAPARDVEHDGPGVERSEPSRHIGRPSREQRIGPREEPHLALEGLTGPCVSIGHGSLVRSRRVTVYARVAKDLPVAANPADPDHPFVVDLRRSPSVRAGTFPYEGDELVTGWHVHDLHQVEYALTGVAEVETAGARYLLPPQQAVWIPARVPHNTSLRNVCSVSVYFHPEMVGTADARARVLPAAPVIREMMTYALRWPIGREGSDRVADAFFEALALLTVDWIEHETPLCLPTTTDPLVAEVMEHTQAHLAEVTAREVCRSVGLSERTLRRRFAAVTGMTWRRYLLESRLLRAMALLAEPADRTVLHVATVVGFDSVSAFTRAFRAYVGETPSAYRRRIAER